MSTRGGLLQFFNVINVQVLSVTVGVATTTILTVSRDSFDCNNIALIISAFSEVYDLEKNQKFVTNIADG